jgi:hypothetical protein
MTESKEVLELIKNQPKITELFKEYSYDEIEKLLQEWMNPTEPANTDTETDSSKSSNKKSLETESATTNKVEDVSAAFDALFSKK